MQKGLLCVLIALLILVTAGCGKGADNPSGQNSTLTSSFTENVLNNYPNSITVYGLERRVFYRYIEQPDYNFVKTSTIDRNTYPYDGQWHVTSDFYRFPINDELLKFVLSKEKLGEYISQNGITDEINTVFIIDAPRTPITICVDTKTQTAFITINEEPTIGDFKYTYEFYTYSEYYNKFKQREGKLIVKGIDVTDKVPMKLYYKYADLPIMGVLKQLGATVKETSKTRYEITFENKKYVLDLTKKTLTQKSTGDFNMLDFEGGTSFKYVNDNDLMVDSTALHIMLHEMKSDYKINIDMDSNTVKIE